MPKEQRRAIVGTLLSLYADLDECKRLMEKVARELICFSKELLERSSELELELQANEVGDLPRESLVQLLRSEQQWLADLAMKLARAAGTA